MDGFVDRFAIAFNCLLASHIYFLSVLSPASKPYNFKSLS